MTIYQNEKDDVKLTVAQQFIEDLKDEIKDIFLGTLMEGKNPSIYSDELL